MPDELADENRITIPYMFNSLTPTCKRVYGKEVLFIVPLEPKGFKRHLNKFLKENPDVVVIDQTEKCLTYQEQRAFVSDVVLAHPSNKIIVLTHSAATLSDAFRCQIYCWRESRFKYIGGIATFGAEPGRIALHVFLVEESIGTLSDRILHEWLNREWKKEDVIELEAICSQVGGGWPRAKLQSILDEIRDSLTEEELRKFQKHYGVEQ